MTCDITDCPGAGTDSVLVRASDQAIDIRTDRFPSDIWNEALDAYELNICQPCHRAIRLGREDAP